MKKVGILKVTNTFVLHILFLLFIGCCDKKKEIDWTAFHFEEGDIVFRKGLSAKSDAVLYADKAGLYSHVGIIVKPDSDFMVVHITPGEREKGENEDLIKMESPAQFFSPQRAKAGAVMRLCDSLEYAKKAAAEAYRLFQKGILFDDDYSLDDSSKMYCAELVWYVYRSAGKDITCGRRSVLENFPIYSGTYIFPSDIFKNDEYLNKDVNAKETDPKEMENTILELSAKAKASIEKKGGIKKSEIIKEDIDKSGETASVESKTTYGNREVNDTTTKYVKVDGKWKISNSK